MIQESVKVGISLHEKIQILQWGKALAPVLSTLHSSYGIGRAPLDVPFPWGPALTLYIQNRRREIYSFRPVNRTGLQNLVEKAVENDRTKR